MCIRITQKLFVQFELIFFAGLSVVALDIILSHEVPLNPKLNETTRKRRSLINGCHNKLRFRIYFISL